MICDIRYIEDSSLWHVSCHQCSQWAAFADPDSTRAEEWAKDHERACKGKTIVADIDASHGIEAHVWSAKDLVSFFLCSKIPNGVARHQVTMPKSEALRFATELAERCAE